MTEWRLYVLACRYLPINEWYEIFIVHDYCTRPQAMIDAARLAYKDAP